MKNFIYKEKQYKVQDGILYERNGNIWRYYPYVSDKELRTKAIANGWRGDIKDNLIDKGFHSINQKQIAV